MVPVEGALEVVGEDGAVLNALDVDNLLTVAVQDGRRVGRDAVLEAEVVVGNAVDLRKLDAVVLGSGRRSALDLFCVVVLVCRLEGWRKLLAVMAVRAATLLENQCTHGSQNRHQRLTCNA